MKDSIIEINCARWRTILFWVCYLLLQFSSGFVPNKLFHWVAFFLQNLTILYNYASVQSIPRLQNISLYWFQTHSYIVFHESHIDRMSICVQISATFSLCSSKCTLQTEASLWNCRSSLLRQPLNSTYSSLMGLP